MLFIKSILLALPLVTQPPTELPGDESEFSYYCGELLTYAMDDSHPMAKLIRDRLSESLFQTESKSELFSRLQLLKTALKERPELIARFSLLDDQMKRSFKARIEKGKQKRLLYTAAGALAGAVIGLPIGKLVSHHSTLGIKVLWISVPAGALVGSGAGFLLGELLTMPPSLEDKDFLSKDLEVIRTDLEK